MTSEYRKSIEVRQEQIKKQTATWPEFKKAAIAYQVQNKDK